MDIFSALWPVLTRPTPAELLALQAALLALEETAGSSRVQTSAGAALAVLGDFYGYLVGLDSKMEAHELAEVASRLDMGAVGGVALENLMESGEQFLERILLGGLSEVLMVLASRQYVRAFNREVDALHRQTAWQIRAHLWRFSAARRPAMSGQQRAALVDGLLAPVFEAQTSSEVKAALLGRLFQVLLLGHVLACKAE